MGAGTMTDGFIPEPHLHGEREGLRPPESGRLTFPVYMGRIAVSRAEKNMNSVLPGQAPGAG